MTDFDIDVPDNPTPPKAKAKKSKAKKYQEPEIDPDIGGYSSAVDLPEVDLSGPTDTPRYVVEPDAKDVAIKFGIIGSGQGGSRLVSSMYDIGYRRVCAINTTSQDFLGLSIPEKNQKVLKAAGGAGKDPEKGKNALNASKEDVLNLMRHSWGEDIERVIICVGAGGGSGSGSALGLYKLARYYLRQLGKPEKVGMIVTLPKKTEGGRVQANAYHLMRDLSFLAEEKSLSPFIMVDNEMIHRMFPNVSAKAFWTTANRNTVGLFDIFNVLACQQSQYVTFDKEDYRSILDSGSIIFGATKLDAYKEDTDISDGLRTNLERTLLAEADIKTASHIAAILCAPDRILDILPQAHIDLAFTTLERIMGGENRDVMVHQGIYEAKKMGLYLYTMVGGLHLPESRLKVMKARAGILDEEELEGIE